MFTRLIGAAKPAAVAAMMLALSACAGYELQGTKGMSPSGDAFSSALYKEYVLLAESEYAQGDYTDSDVFAQRAKASASGTPPEPEALNARNIPSQAQGELAAARASLMNALSGGAKTAKPAAAARAQAAFDCWMEQQHENFQPDHIKACKDRFDAAMAEIGTPVATPPAPAGVTFVNFTVYFEFDQADLTAQTQSTLVDAANAADAMGASSVTISGYADRSGPEDYNMRLSQRRADAVAKELTSLIGANAPAMTLLAFGETQNEVVTPDGVKEPKNRRVKIEIRK